MKHIQHWSSVKCYIDCRPATSPYLSKGLRREMKTILLFPSLMPSVNTSSGRRAHPLTLDATRFTMGPRRSIWPVVVVGVVLLLVGFAILPGSSRDTAGTKSKWGSRTTFPDHLDNTDEWTHYGVVRASNCDSFCVDTFQPLTILLSLYSISELSLFCSSWLDSPFLPLYVLDSGSTWAEIWISLRRLQKIPNSDVFLSLPQSFLDTSSQHIASK